MGNYYCVCDGENNSENASRNTSINPQDPLNRVNKESAFEIKIDEIPSIQRSSNISKKRIVQDFELINKEFHNIENTTFSLASRETPRMESLSPHTHYKLNEMDLGCGPNVQVPPPIYTDQLNPLPSLSEGITHSHVPYDGGSNEKKDYSNISNVEDNSKYKNYPLEISELLKNIKHEASSVITPTNEISRITQNKIVDSKYEELAILEEEIANQLKKIRQKYSSRGKEFAIENVVARNKLLSENNEMLYEGWLYKYKSGLNIKYINRFCQVDKMYFKYYKNQFKSTNWLTKPLMQIPLTFIHSVKRVRKKVPELTNVRIGKSLRFHFEIFLEGSPPKQTDEVDFSEGRSRVFKTPAKSGNYNSSIKEKQKTLTLPVQRVENSGFIYIPHKYSPVMRESECGIGNTDTRSVVEARVRKDIENELKGGEYGYGCGCGCGCGYGCGERGGSEYSRTSTMVYKNTSTHTEYFYTENNRLLFATDKQVDADKWIFILNWLVNQLKHIRHVEEGEGMNPIFQEEEKEIFGQVIHDDELNYFEEGIIE